MKTYMTENDNNSKRNLPPPFHGDNTWASRAPVPPISNADVYARSVIIIKAVPKI
jgi:hypothetical protein